MRTTPISRAARLVAGLAAVALTATACGAGGGTDADASGGSGSGAAKTITLGFIPSWTDGLSTAWLWKDVLEQRGFQVNMKKISDAAPLYAGLAKGDVDVYPSGWPEVTHKDYMAKYGKDLEDLGTWYDGAVLTLAVPDYTPVDSIADLAGHADLFDGKIIGIEPGAGLTRTTKESVMPKYGLTGSYTLVESSTTAMLAELQSAIDEHKNIVVTLWHPFWAYNKFPHLKDLKDPKGALGKPEGLHELAHKGFSAKFPEVADLMNNFHLTDEQYGSLENMVVNEYGKGKYAEAVDAWLKDNPDVAKSLGVTA